MSNGSLITSSESGTGENARVRACVCVCVRAFLCAMCGVSSERLFFARVTTAFQHCFILVAVLLASRLRLPPHQLRPWPKLQCHTLVQQHVQ